MRDGDLVGARQGPDREVYGILAVVADVGVRLLRAQLDRTDVGDADDLVGILADDQALKFLDAAQIGIGEEIDLDRAAFGLADRAQEIVAGESALDLLGSDCEGGQLFRVQPDLHRLRTSAFDGDPLDIGQGAELRLDLARQIVGELRRRHGLRRRADVEGRISTVRTLDVDDRRFRFGRQLAPDLVEPVAHFGQRDRARMVQLQAHGDGADPGDAGRFDIVDARDGRDGALDRGGDEATDRFGRGADIDGRDADR